MVTTWDKLFQIAEELDWDLTYEAKDSGALYEIDFRKYSPAGEDFGFYCEADAPEEMAKEVMRYLVDFDVDEHVKLVMDMDGAPGLRELVHDAEDIEDMIDELVGHLYDAE